MRPRMFLSKFSKYNFLDRNAAQFAIQWKSRIFPGILSGFLFVQICLPRYFPSSFPAHHHHSEMQHICQIFCSLILQTILFATSFFAMFTNIWYMIIFTKLYYAILSRTNILWNKDIWCRGKQGHQLEVLGKADIVLCLSPTACVHPLVNNCFLIFAFVCFLYFYLPTILSKRSSFRDLSKIKA